MRYYCVMKKFIQSLSSLIIFLIPLCVSAQQDQALRNQIEEIAKPVKGIIGVSILGIESRDTLSLNGNARLVMHSVFKFPIALTVLHLIDTGKLTLDQPVHIKKRDMPKNLHSPLRDKYPDGNVDLPISELLSYMVSQSDNSACDMLLKLIGGPQRVQAYMLQLGIRGIAVRASEADMASSWELQYVNWCKPKEMTVLLDQFYAGKIVTKTAPLFYIK